MPLIPHIPNEIAAELLYYLTENDISRYREVSKSWKGYIEKGELHLPIHVVKASTYFKYKNIMALCEKTEEFGNVGIEKFQNVCFHELYLNFNADYQEILTLVNQNYGRLTAKNLILHIDSAVYLRHDHYFLCNIVNCADLDISIYEDTYDFMINNRESFRVPFAEKLSIRYFYFNPENDTEDELLKFIFDEKAYENRELLELRASRRQSFGQELIVKFLKNFMACKRPEKIFKTVIFYSENFDFMWSEQLQKMWLQYKEEEAVDKLEAPYMAYVKTRSDTWTLKMKYDRRNQWEFKVFKS